MRICDIAQNSLTAILDVLCTENTNPDIKSYDVFNRTYRQITRIAAVAFLTLAATWSIPFTLTLTAAYIIAGGGVLGAIGGRMAIVPSPIIAGIFV